MRTAACWLAIFARRRLTRVCASSLRTICGLRGAIMM